MKIKATVKNMIVIGLAIGILIGTFVLRISRDISLDYNIWLSLGKQETYNTSDYVRFRFDRQDKYIQGKWLIKQITCGPNDLLLNTNNIITCNGKVIARILQEDKNGNILQGLSFSGYIPNGYYFVQGTHERSYDSRYFGLVNIKELKEKVIPLRSIIVW